MIFFIIFLLAIFFAKLEHKFSINTSTLQNNKRKVFKGAKILGLLMFLLSALRNVDVGIDTLHYYESFHTGISRFIEFGYWFIRNISLLFGNSFQVFLFLFAMATFVPFFAMLKRESINISFSLLIYISFSNFFYPETFNIIRATASVGFFTLAVSYWVAKHFKISLFLFFVSCTFHVSSILVCAIFFAINYIQRFSKKITIFFILVSFLFGFLFQYGFSEYANRVSILLSNISGDFSSYYVEHFVNLDETNFNIIGTLTSMLPFTLFALFTYDDENSKNIYYKLFTIGVILSNIFISITLIYRITMFFTLMLVVVLPNTYNRLKGTKLYMVNGLVIFMLLWYVYKVFITTSDNMAGILPYKFFFE